MALPTRAEGMIALDLLLMCQECWLSQETMVLKHLKQVQPSKCLLTLLFQLYVFPPGWEVNSLAEGKIKGLALCHWQAGIKMSDVLLSNLVCYWWSSHWPLTCREESVFWSWVREDSAWYTLYLFSQSSLDHEQLTHFLSNFLLTSLHVAV